MYRSIITLFLLKQYNVYQFTLDDTTVQKFRVGKILLIILLCWFGAQETFLLIIIINIDNSHFTIHSTVTFDQFNAFLRHKKY